jgi:hypothetical protein
MLNPFLISLPKGGTLTTSCHLLAFFLLAWLGLGAAPANQSTIAHAAATIPPILYGVTQPIGPTAEPCATEATTSGALLLAPAEDWQSRIESASPGDTFLLRGGVYQATELLKVPAGEAGRPITLKPYNCEAVLLYASLRLRSHTRLAGLQLETKNLADDRWVIRIDGQEGGPIEGVVLRHNTILGGSIDAIRILDNVRRVLITGNEINGGGNGHTLFVTAEERLLLPDRIEISQNRLAKSYYVTPAEDMFQVRDVGKVFFHHNTCTAGVNMEECVDIKSTAMPVTISYNLFDGDQLHQQGTGEDGAGGCMVIHETDGQPDNHWIEHNFFKNCRGTALRFATGSEDSISRATVRWNLFVQTGVAEAGVIAIWQAQGVVWQQNTHINGHLKLGDEQQLKLPQDTVIQNNLFYRTRIDDRTRPPDSTYHCSHNLLFEGSGTGFAHSPCPQLLTADPLFVDVAGGDFHLQPSTPARNAGAEALTLGAYPYQFIDFEPQVYLPLITSEP